GCCERLSGRPLAYLSPPHHDPRGRRAPLRLVRHPIPDEQEKEEHHEPHHHHPRRRNGRRHPRGHPAPPGEAPPGGLTRDEARRPHPLPPRLPRPPPRLRPREAAL